MTWPTLVMTAIIVKWTYIYDNDNDNFYSKEKKNITNQGEK